MIKLKAKGILDKHKIQNTCENCSIGQAKAGISMYDIVIASTHLASQLNTNTKTKIIALKNILDVKKMEAVRCLRALYQNALRKPLPLLGRG